MQTVQGRTCEIVLCYLFFSRFCGKITLLTIPKTILYSLPWRLGIAKALIIVLNNSKQLKEYQKYSDIFRKTAVNKILCCNA